MADASINRDPGTKFWIGTATHASASEFMLDADDLRCYLGEQASAENGEYAEDWLTDPFTPDQAAQINAHLAKIAELIQKFQPPEFWQVNDVQEHMVLEAQS
jgi:hypothetical protein